MASKIAPRLKQTLPICPRPVLLQRPILRQPTPWRSYATQTRFKPRVGHIFGALALAGIGATSYGLYLYYESFKTWPQAVRTPLRAAVRAQEQGAFEYSERFYREALDAARGLPLDGRDSFGKDRDLKISGILVALAGLLEQANKTGAALEVYEDAFDELQSTDQSGILKMRTIGIAQKVGHLATAIGTPDNLALAEERMGWAVTELLKASSTDEQRRSATEKTERGESGLEMQDLNPPQWISSVDIGASMENLGSFYLAQNNPDYAIPLFTQVLKVLLPKKAPGVPTPTYNDRCHAGTISNNLSSAYALNPTTPNLEKAISWAQNAVHIASHTQGDAERENKQSEAAECGPCLAVGQFNLGLLREMTKEHKDAIEWYQKSLATSRSIRFVDGARQAASALQRMQSTAK